VDEGILIAENRQHLLKNKRIDEFLGQDSQNYLNSFESGLHKIEKDDRTLLILKNESIFGSISIVRDITLDDIAEQTRARERRMFSLGELSSSFAHEIRNPLNTISMIIQQLEITGEKSKRHLKTVFSEIHRLNGIVNEFIQIAKMPQINKELVSVEELFRETHDFYEMKLAKLGAQLQIEWENAALKQKVWFDREKMKGCWINLIENSLAAGATQLTLNIHLFRGFIKLVFHDNGKGMSTETTDRAFDLYFTTRPNGSGLGLPFVQRLISAHGGYVKIESGIEKGCTVALFLPLDKGSAS